MPVRHLPNEPLNHSSAAIVEHSRMDGQRSEFASRLACEASATANQSVPVAILRQEKGSPITQHDIESPVPHTQAARDLAKHIHEAGKEVVFLGEMHSRLSDRFFYLTALNLAAYSGAKPVVLLETFTSEKLNRFIDDLYAGKTSYDKFEELASQELYDIALAAAAHYDVPEDEFEFTLENARDRIKTDVGKWYQIGVKPYFIDGARFEPGANRDEHMANEVIRIHEKYPDNVILAQLGVLHSQLEPDLVPHHTLVEGTDRWNGIPVSRSDGGNPAAKRVRSYFSGGSGEGADDSSHDPVLSIFSVLYRERDDFRPEVVPLAEAPSGRTAFFAGLSPGTLTKLTLDDGGFKPGTFDGIIPIYNEAWHPSPYRTRIPLIDDMWPDSPPPEAAGDGCLVSPRSQKISPRGAQDLLKFLRIEGQRRNRG